MNRLFFPVLALNIMWPVLAVEPAAARGLKAAPATDWEEDFRRCLIRKHFDRGNVTISISGSALEIYVLWDDEQRLEDLGEANIRAEIDRERFELQVRKSDLGTNVATYELGPFATIAPLWSKGRELTLAFAGHPDRDLRLPIGNGKKAIGFLNKCEDYWKKWRARHP